MENQQPRRSNDLAFWVLLIVLVYLAWPTLGQGHVVAQPAPMPQPIIINQTSAAPALPAPTLDCTTAVRTVPLGWEEGIGGPTPPCWNQWSKAQRIEFLNYVQKQAQSKP